jgi:tRNA-dihydrouridine synthase 4
MMTFQFVVVVVLQFCVAMNKFGKAAHSSFWNQLGCPKYISAPMVDQSNMAWRVLVRKNGCDLAFSQMMQAKNLIVDKGYRKDCIDWNDYSTMNGSHALELEGQKFDRPLIVQLAGDNPDFVVQAGKYFDKDVTAIDLNLGCPQNCAKRSNYGAYLLTQRTTILQVLTAMIKELACPITAKIRRLDSDEETIALAQAIEACGVSMLTVHGRTVRQTKLFVGPADWDIIKKIKNAVNIPVVANGGIGCWEDANRCLEYTGADAVMSSEALLENPKLFSKEGSFQFRENYVAFQLQTVREYLDLVLSYPLPRPLYTVLHGHLFKMLHRFFSVRAHHDLRDRLAEAKLQDILQIVDDLDQRMKKISYDTKYAEENGLIGMTTWYMRHRDEKAQQRILSIPRNSVAPNREAKSEVDLQALKEKLLAKHAEKLKAKQF